MGHQSTQTLSEVIAERKRLYALRARHRRMETVLLKVNRYFKEGSMTSKEFDDMLREVNALATET